VENLEENVTLLGLSSCHSILKSQCGKQKCQSEPEIILPAEGKKNPAKEKLYVFSTEEDSFSESETSNEEDSENNRNEIEVDPCDNSVERSWGSLCLPHLETDVEGKWYAVIWLGKRTKSLFIGKVLRRFLVD